jgi:hypothetical protein
MPACASKRLSLVSLLLTAALASCAPQASKTENPAPARPGGGTGGSGPSGGSPGNGGSTGAGGTTGGSASGGSGPGAGMATTGGSSGGSVPVDGGASPIVAGPVIPLPMVVTTQYSNQGWFGDTSLTSAISSGMLIQQGTSVTGPCAMRAPDARGQCLKIVYTPPAGLVPPTKDGKPAGYVGVFFLTTILMADPNAIPPLKIGDANWGSQPGKNVAPGATKIAFSAASETEGLSVGFKAGVTNDSLLLMDQVEVLGTAWKSLAISLVGQSYGTNLIGAFAWVISDTTKPATFYLDNIVWE